MHLLSTDDLHAKQAGGPVCHCSVVTKVHGLWQHVTAFRYGFCIRNSGRSNDMQDKRARQLINSCSKLVRSQAICGQQPAALLRA